MIKFFLRGKRFKFHYFGQMTENSYLTVSNHQIWVILLDSEQIHLYEDQKFFATSQMGEHIKRTRGWIFSSAAQARAQALARGQYKKN